jgi:hypothetical protein
LHAVGTADARRRIDAVLVDCAQVAVLIDPDYDRVVVRRRRPLAHPDTPLLVARH